MPVLFMTAEAPAISGTQMLIALGIGIAILIFLILKTKVHAFLALIVAAVAVGLIGGMDPNKTVSSITSGFGGTLGSIGIIIGFGVMMGQIFEISGAAERMARTFLKMFGKKHEEIALSLTGFIVSIPIFCDSGFVILSPLVKAIARQTKKSVVGLGIALAAGLVITHSMVPPTPGPLGVAGTFGVDVGQFLLWGIILAIPMALATLVYAKWMGKQIYQLPDEDGEGWIRPPYQAPVYDLTSEDKGHNLPGTFVSFFPLLLPIVLILVNTVTAAMGLKEGIFSILKFIGTPVIAVGLGLIAAIYMLAFHTPKKVVMHEMEKGIRSAGIIIFVTGAGGALGQVLRDSGVGNFIAEQIAQTPIPIIILPFIVATLVRFVQGSGTVAMITSASITAPIVAAAGGNMVFAALAASMGSLFFSYFNDSYYWVVNRMLGIEDTKEQIRVWSFTSTIAWAVGFVEILLIGLFV